MLRFIRETEREREGERRGRERYSSASRTGRGNFTHHFYCNLLQMFVAFGFVWLLLLLLLPQRVFLLFFVQPTGQTGFWLMAKFATFSRCCSCCCKILFKPSGKRCLHMTSECCLGRPGKETQARRAADFKPKAKTKTNNTTTTKSSAG